MAIHYSHTIHLTSNKLKHGFYSGEDPMKKFCADLRKHVTEIINFEKKEMLPFEKKKK